MGKTLHIVVLAAFLLGIIAPACGFSWGGKYSVVEICTAKGLESRVIADNSNSSDAPDHKTKEKCQFCFTHANLAGHMPQAVILEPLKFQAEKLKFALYETITLSRVGSNLSARGPPVLV